MSAHKDSRPGQGSAEGSTDGSAGARVETAGAFDIRNVIGLLLGLFGLVLVVMGLVAFTPAEAAKTGGPNANLWAGLSMVAVALAFLVWTRLDPIRLIVRDDEDSTPSPPDIAPQG